MNHSILAEKEDHSTQGIHHTPNNFHQEHFINGIPTQGGSSPSVAGARPIAMHCFDAGDIHRIYQPGFV